MRYQKLKEILTAFGLNHNYIFRTFPLGLTKDVIKKHYENPWEYLPEDLRVLFIHIPKCAGTSISRALYQNGMGHRAAALYMAWDAKRFRATPTFAVVRNPYDRFCSVFHHYTKSPQRSKNEELIWRSFFAVYYSPSNLAHALARDRRLRSRFMSLTHARPQVDWVMVGSKIIVDHLFLFEELTRLENFLRECLGDQAFSLPTVNSSRREKEWEAELDPRARGIIEDLYRYDVSLWEAMH